MRELELIKSLESDNRDFELLAIYFEEAVEEVSLFGCLPVTGQEKARQLRERIAENEALIEHPNATPAEIISQARKMLAAFGIAAGDVFNDFIIVINPCVTNPTMSICQGT